MAAAAVEQFKPLYTRIGLLKSVDFIPLFPTHPEANLDNSFRHVLPFYSNKDDTASAVNKTLGNHWNSKSVNNSIYSNLLAVQLRLPSWDDKGKEEIWQSSEHYFQCAKYSPGDRNFMKTLSPGQVASYGQRRLKLGKSQISKIASLRNAKEPYPVKPDGKDYEVDDVSSPAIVFPGGRAGWDDGKIGVMYDALSAKFSDAHPELRDQLLATDDAWLVEHTKNDVQWADGSDGKGTNFLGKLLMFRRAELLKQQNKKDGHDPVAWRKFVTEDETSVLFLKTKQSELLRYV